MDSSEDTQYSFGTGISTHIETIPIRVLITTDDYEIDGYMHIKPGSYQSRISDTLNGKALSYLPLTNVRYQNIHKPDDLTRKVETLIIRMDTIKMVAPQNGAEIIPKKFESAIGEDEEKAAADNKAASERTALIRSVSEL
jgi:hypothetical protein